MNTKLYLGSTEILYKCHVMKILYGGWTEHQTWTLKEHEEMIVWIKWWEKMIVWRVQKDSWVMDNYRHHLFHIKWPTYLTVWSFSYSCIQQIKHELTYFPSSPTELHRVWVDMRRTSACCPSSPCVFGFCLPLVEPFLPPFLSHWAMNHIWCLELARSC